MTDLAKTLFFFGFILIGAGLLLTFFGKTGLGRFPGDIYIRKGSFVFYFPLMTCLLASAALTLIFSFFGKR
ncbi:MAG TPA: DUF2905 domain-containing protein [Verrucomicrobiae bacterium]|nr:DUF2905 domain-containing protein [Verrucomicrobiae bacterium]